MSTPSTASRGLAGAFRLLVRPPLARIAPESNAFRLISRAMAAERLIPRRGCTHTPHGLLVTAPGADYANGAILHLHGGAFIAGSPYTHSNFAYTLSKRTGKPVLLADYRLAPRHRWPAAREDVRAAHHYLLDRGVPPQLLTVSGDSAGGYLAAELVHGLLARAEPLPGAVVLISPWLDPTCTAALAADAAKPDPFLPAALLRRCAVSYAGGEELDEVLARDFTGWPDTMIHVGDTECLLDDARRLAAALANASVRHEYRVWPGQIHDFPLFGALPEARAAMTRTAQFLRTEVTT